MKAEEPSRKSWIERLDARNQRWADGLHPEVTVAAREYGLVSIRLTLPQRAEGREPGGLFQGFGGRALWDRTTARGETTRAHLVSTVFALSAPQSVPGHNHRIFVISLSSLGGDHIDLLLRERWFNLAEGQARIEQMRAHFAAGGTLSTIPDRASTRQTP